MSKRCVTIDKKEYWVEPDEFKPIYYEEYCNLSLLDDVEFVERIVALINDIGDTLYPLEVVMDTTTRESYGGYFTINIRSTDSKNKFYLFCEAEQPNGFILSKIKTLRKFYHMFEWAIDHRTLYLYIHEELFKDFKTHFHWYISNSSFTYDNLLHLTMIVKNAGNEFKTVLESYIPYIDRWTILDTGSTDNTVQNIKDTLGKRVRGELFQEPFINFRDSRNRCLDLAGKNSKFIIMLDDTYIIQRNLRGFLKKVRGDQFGESFGIFIHSKDMEYSSNRIIKTVYNLRYMYKIHEVIQENKCIMVPKQDGWVFDAINEYMDKRTADRKQLDFKLLQESITEESENPRHLYYMAQTYVCVKDYENAYKYFLRRFYHSKDGFFQEKFDAGFEAARIAQYQLNKPWEECLFLYNETEKVDPKRPEPSYFIGIYHYTQKNFKEAYRYILKAYRLGYPEYAQFSLKPSLSFYFVPKLLTELSYSMKSEEPDAFKIGLEVSEFFLKSNYPETPETPNCKELVMDWNRIYSLLNQLKPNCTVVVPEKPYLCIVSPGNWKKWTGKSLDTDGLGGSETHTVEIADLFQNKLKSFNVIVFCNCVETIYNNVIYKPLEQYPNFISENYVHTSIICRYSEYIPVTIYSPVDNIIVISHDVQLSGLIIPIHPKIRKVICLTHWHKQLFDTQFPQLNNISTVCHHGIDIDRFDKAYLEKPSTMGFRPRFIYSSFANRGLHILLEMWKSVLEIYPNAILMIYTDLDNEWFKTNYPDIRKQIYSLLSMYLNRSVFYFGWVNKERLVKAWTNADIWLYPCVWEETFCLTALEAAASRTLAITSDLAALKETVGDRGVLISGDPSTQQWKDEALKQIQKVLTNKQIYNEFIQSNYQWAKEHKWINNPIINIVKPGLEYRNVYNWTVDYPVGSKNVIEQILRDVVVDDTVSPLFLDICSHTGTIGLELLKLFRGNCIMIDTGTVYPSFENNLKLSGLSQKVRFYKVSKKTSFLDILQALYKNIEEPIVIHIDICNYLKQNKNEYELVCILSIVWSLLKVKGLLILYTEGLTKTFIDDFLNKIVKLTGYATYKQENGYICIQKLREKVTIIEEEMG